MKKELEAAGYEVDLQYASNDVSTQVSQLENQVANGCDLLVVASIDGSSLGEPLKQAKEAGIPVISYDRLLMNSDAVTYYATFDNYKVGQKQGEYSQVVLVTITVTSSSAEQWMYFRNILMKVSW